MKLISMTDFVLEQELNLCDDYKKSYGKMVKYANFLKQPLKLEMFVPCDESGNVLEYCPFTKNNETNLESVERLSIYELAKERVLFDFNGGIKLIRNKDNFFIIEDKNGVFLRILKGKTRTTVETLFKFSVDITLTQSAIKKIGL